MFALWLTCSHISLAMTVSCTKSQSASRSFDIIENAVVEERGKFPFSLGWRF